MRDVAHDRRHVDDVVALQHAQFVVVKIKQLHGDAPLLDGYEDAVADLVVDRLGQVPLAGRVLDEDHLAGADLAALAVAGGDLHPGVEIDDVLPPRRRMPIEVIGRRDFAEDDAGRRQTLGELAPARLLGPIDLDVSEVGLAARVGVEVVYPHWRLSLEIGYGAPY